MEAGRSGHGVLGRGCVLQANGAEPSGPACAACAITLCTDLSPPATSCLQRIARAMVLPRHRLIAEEGARAKRFFCITDGAVELSKALPDGRRQITGLLFAGDFLGPLGGARDWSCSARTLTQVSACAFDRLAFSRALKLHPEIEDRLLDMASETLAEAYRHMLLLGRKNADERVASFLLLMTQRGQRRTVATAEGAMIPMGRAEIADYLGLKLETVSRVLTRLKELGLIELHGPRRVLVQAPERLEAMAEGLAEAPGSGTRGGAGRE